MAACGALTASGLRIQKAEIKYKKPTAFAVGETTGNGGEGVKILEDLGPHYRTGSHAQIFYSARRFELFSRNQRIQTAARSPPQGKLSICKQLRSTACSVRAPWWRFSANYFPRHLEVPPGGRVESLERFGPGPRRYCREIRKTFLFGLNSDLALSQWNALKIAAKFRVGG